jgi:hypothetical protein
MFTSMCLKYIEIINATIFALHILRILGRALLIPSGYRVTQCGYTYSVRLAKLLWRSPGADVVSLWRDLANYVY